MANFLNSAISTTDWNLIGTTLANGLNAVIHTGYNFVTTFKWEKFGKSIGQSINTFFSKVDWKTAGKTLGEGIKGILSSITSFIQEIDWAEIAKDIEEFITNIDWEGIISKWYSAVGSATGALWSMILQICWDILKKIGEFFQGKIEECGGDIIAGLLKGIVDALIGIGEWIYNNMIYPIVKAFCDTLGIHSPSTVFAEFGQNIVQGLFDGIQNLVEIITQIWQNMKDTAIQIFNNIKEKIQTIWNNIKESTNSIWNNIKSIISNLINTIKTIISNILNTIKTTWQNVWNGIKTFASNVWNGIKSIFSGAGNWFTNIFQKAYNGIRNVFSSIGSFFSGIWGNIKNTFSSLGTSIGNAISGAVKSGINGVISMIERTINSAINLINGGINLINQIPGVYVGRVSTLSLPRLAKGGVLTQETAFIGGEYSGASSNPEIVTPENIMYDTMRKALSDSDLGNNNDRPIYLTVNVSNKKLGQILLEDLRDMKRQTGKDIDALVN